MDYVAIIEKFGNGYSAYLPDLPGCIAAAETLEETRTLIREAVELHVLDMRARGEPVPLPTSQAEVVQIGGVEDAARAA